MSDDNVSIVLPRQHAQSLYHLVDAATVKGLKGAQAVVVIMAAIETALKTSDED